MKLLRGMRVQCTDRTKVPQSIWEPERITNPELLLFDFQSSRLASLLL